MLRTKRMINLCCSTDSSQLSRFGLADNDIDVAFTTSRLDVSKNFLYLSSTDLVSSSTMHHFIVDKITARKIP